jgi:hypothetical protein
MERLGLAWVLVDGRPRCVSEFAALPPRRRPPAACPQCGRRLILKLGRIRRHHAAHAPNDVCEATRPETALHLDTKLYLAAQLESVVATDPTLVIRQRCEGTPFETCDAAREERWATGWDEVVVEAGVAARFRPDVLLRKNGVAIGAIEVLVSHRVPDEKAAALESSGVPWIEVRAGAELLEGDTAWCADRALLVERLGLRGTSRTWRCHGHMRHARRLRSARVVDIYREGGVRDRLIYRLDEQVVEDVVTALVLSRHGAGREVASCACDDRSARRAAWRALRIAFTDDVRRSLGSGEAFADSPMRWASGDAAANLVEEALHDLCPGDATPLATRYPRRWYFARALARWFLPADMRDVRWDRPEHDAFAAHPAWTASRAVVRERPVPEYAWQGGGVIFARRPSPAAFGVPTSTVPNGPISVGTLDVAGQPRRALVVLTAVVEDDLVRAVDRSLDAEQVEHLWLSHPRDWAGSRADLPWAAAGRDARGRDVVLIDGVGVFRAAAFVEAFRRGDAKVRPAAVQARMAARVSALRAR